MKSRQQYSGERKFSKPCRITTLRRNVGFFWDNFTKSMEQVVCAVTHSQPGTLSQPIYTYLFMLSLVVSHTQIVTNAWLPSLATVLWAQKRGGVGVPIRNRTRRQWVVNVERHDSYHPRHLFPCSLYDRRNSRFLCNSNGHYRFQNSPPLFTTVNKIIRRCYLNAWASIAFSEIKAWP